MTNSSAIFTIVSNNYLHFARTLLQSVAAHHPDAKRYCVIVDVDLHHAQALHDEFETISPDQLQLPDGQDFLFQYTILELNTAVKPWGMQHLLQRGHKQVIYLDPDIRLYRRMNEVQALLEKGADVVLTPHLLAPVTDNFHPAELDIRRAGAYNLGFCAVRDSDNTRNYLRWWQGKLHHDCVVAVDKGIFVDQSWMDLVPGLFENVALLRHPGYNVAYWNLGQRQLTRQETTGDFLANSQPLIFFHYSGLDPQQPYNVSKHQNRFTFDNINEPARFLIRDYVQALFAHGAATFERLPYGFGHYANGTPIAAAERIRFRDDPSLRQQCGGKPFEHPEILSLRHMPAAAASQAHHLDPAHVQRLHDIYQSLLGRPPEREALVARCPRMGHRLGMARTVFSVGLSREARATPGWLARLLRLCERARVTPMPVKQWLIRPLSRVLEAVGKRWPGFAYHPPAALYPPGSAHTQTVRTQRNRAAPRQDADELCCPVGINLIGYLRAEHGVGEAARSFARACAAADVPFSATEVGNQGQTPQRDTRILELAQSGTYAVDLLYVNADQTCLTAQQLQSTGRAQSGYTIGFWHWEQPEFPAGLHSAFAHVNEVWVPSTFVQDAVAAVSPVPVCKIPHALQFQPTPGIGREQFGLPPDKQLVLVMYDFHSYQYRKNPQAAIAAYRLAAQNYPHLALIIKTVNGQHHAEAYAELRDNVHDLPNVTFIDNFLTRQQTWDLQSCCDILLSLHRAEGFGLAPAEMMYLGKSVIATGWSANMDFMTAENSMPVRYQLKALDRDLGAYPSGPLWAEADIEHAAWCLGQLASQPDLVQRLGRQAARDVQRQLSPQAVGKQIRQRLQMLGGWHPNLIG
jgi:glycosyltransferase involved in cell wall biosynthesis